MSAEKITVYSLPDLKNTTDDALPIYLNSLKFTQTHHLTDVRLLIGYTSFLICSACFYWDYTYGYEATKAYTAIACVCYFLLNAILTYWVFYIERGVVYSGTTPDGKCTVEMGSRMRKFQPLYQLSVRVWEKDAGGKGRVIEEKTVRRPFREWFDGEGGFVTSRFQEMVASNIGVVGEVDGKRVVRKEVEGDREKEKKKEGVPKSMDDKWEALLRESSDLVGGESTGAETKKGGKKRGKKV